jgi:SAM-dependent methyltransferase
MALGQPRARFVGIDLSARQIEMARQTAAALGLGNIELSRRDIADVDASWGAFDYIICHGVYSWVPAPVRAKILAICRDHLAPSGVAYVSYNTLPGWHLRSIVRDMMVYHSAPFEGAAEKVRHARALLDFLAQSVPTSQPYGMLLRQELDLIRDLPDSYLFHEHLEDVNDAVYFHQFADAARRHGLDYLGEAEFGQMLMSGFSPQVVDALQRFGSDVIRTEQYMDFLRKRTFRQTLLVREGTPLRRNLADVTLEGLVAASAVAAESERPSLAEGAVETFRTPGAVTHRIGDRLTKAALLELAQRWPLSVPVGELASACRARLLRDAGAATGGTIDGAAGVTTHADDVKALSGRLLQGFAAHAVELRMRAPRLVAAPSTRPLASPLARLQAPRSATVTNLRHEPVALDALQRRLLPLLDGTRDIEALVAVMTNQAKEGVIGMRAVANGPVLTDPVEIARTLHRAVETELPLLGGAALLQA